MFFIWPFHLLFFFQKTSLGWCKLSFISTFERKQFSMSPLCFVSFMDTCLSVQFVPFHWKWLVFTSFIRSQSALLFCIKEFGSIFEYFVLKWSNQQKRMNEIFKFALVLTNRHWPFLSFFSFFFQWIQCLLVMQDMHSIRTCSHFYPCM